MNAQKWTVGLIFLSGFAGGALVALTFAGLLVMDLRADIDASNVAMKDAIRQVREANEGVTVMLEMPPAGTAASVLLDFAGVALPAGAAIPPVPRWAVAGRVRPQVYGPARGAQWYYFRGPGKPIEGPYPAESLPERGRP